MARIARVKLLLAVMKVTRIWVAHPALKHIQHDMYFILQKDTF